MNLAEYRAEFPVTRDWAYLNHAAVAPLPERVVRTLERFVRARQRGDMALEDWPPATEETRGLAARLVGASPGEIAFINSTSDGLNLAANALPIASGENVILCDMEFPANVYPWVNLERRGVEVRIIPHDGGGLSPAGLAAAMDERTRVVAVSSAQFLSGYRADLPALSRLCHAAGAYLVVDGIQSLGVVPMDVRAAGLDILVTQGAKWLLAPIGIGFIYVRQELIGQLYPPYAYYRAVPAPEPWLHYDWTLRDDARRFEVSSPNVIGLYGLREALALLLEVGIEHIYPHVLDLGDRLLAGLDDLDIEVLTPRERERRAGIVTCRTADVAGDLQRLHEARVQVSLREGYLRIAPHFYNLPEEIDQLLNVLEGSR
jgi:cysteine desulfurase/selenocysteine lyase